MSPCASRALLRRARVLCGALGLLSLAPHAAAKSEHPPPSPYAILGIALAGPPSLEPVAICNPSDDARLASPLAALERDGVDAALTALDEVSADGDEGFAAELEVLRASLAARRSSPGKDAAGDLRSAAEGAGAPRSRACAWLELARAELAAGRLAEVRAESLRALRAYGEKPAPAPVARAAAHYRAESLYRAGQVDAAKPIFEELARGSTPVARAARLRLADLHYVSAPDASRRKEVEAILESGDEAVTSPELWAPRMAEWALAEGDAAGALAWLERAPSALSSQEKLAVSMRRADALYLLERGDEGGAILHELADRAATEPLRQLATVRLIDLESPSGDEPLAHLERAARSELRGLALYARSILADHLAAAGKDEAALDLLVAIAYESAPGEIEESLPDQIDQVLASLAQGHDCVGLLAAAGGRRTLLLKHAGAPEPFLQLGDCYLELGMPRAALDVYRGATRAFGPDLAKQITLRSARAEFAMGEVEAARAAARSNLQLITVPVWEWRLLYGEILLGDERPEAAIRVLAPLARDVAKGQLGGAQAQRALWLLANAAADQGSSYTLRAQLRGGLAALARDPVPDAPFGETLLVTADLHRTAGETEHARILYRDAFVALPPGPMRSLAAYWRGALARDVDEARAAWTEVAEEDDAWALMARNELRFSQTRASLGRSELRPGSRASGPGEVSP